MKLLNEYHRAIRIISMTIKELELNLDGLVVLTEVGSNNYLYTPLIAAMAGARQVYAWTADTQYGGAVNIKDQCLIMAKKLGVASRVQIVTNEMVTSQISEADIITNSGFLRPLDGAFLVHTKPGVVIPLMYESWELRPGDIDIEYCKRKKIKVAGTWESHPSISVFDTVGSLAVKLANEAGYEVVHNNIVVWSDDHFGKVAVRSFENAGANSVRLCNKAEDLMHDFECVDFIYVCDYDESRPMFGEGGVLNLESLIEINRAFGVVHLYGDVDAELVAKAGIPVYPMKRGRPSVMTFTLGHLGLNPILKLQAAGLKVGKELRSGVLSSLSQPVV